MLTINFVLHFTLRTLWIGNIGLASVFPEGINENSDRNSQHFLSRLKARFPELQRQRVGGHHLKIVPARFERDSFYINIPFQYFPEEALQ